MSFYSLSCCLHGSACLGRAGRWRRRRKRRSFLQKALQGLVLSRVVVCFPPFSRHVPGTRTGSLLSRLPVFLPALEGKAALEDLGGSPFPTPVKRLVVLNWLKPSFMVCNEMRSLQNTVWFPLSGCWVCVRQTVHLVIRALIGSHA